MSAVDRDPYRAINFEVDIGADVTGFAEISGLGCEIDYHYDSAADDAADRRPRKITGRVNDITLRRAVTGDLSVWDWVRNAMSGNDEPRTVTITLLDARRVPACSWVLREARPTKWVGPILDANGGGVAMEELVLSADSLEYNAAGTVNTD